MQKIIGEHIRLSAMLYFNNPSAPEKLQYDSDQDTLLDCKEPLNETEGFPFVFSSLTQNMRDNGRWRAPYSSWQDESWKGWFSSDR